MDGMLACLTSCSLSVKERITVLHRLSLRTSDTRWKEPGKARIQKCWLLPLKVSVLFIAQVIDIFSSCFI